MRQKGNEQTEILREILKWIKFTAAKEVKTVLMATLDTEIKRQIYHLSDGNRGSVEISKLVDTSDRTVRRYWALWARQGIVGSLRVRGGERYKKSFELDDFGIEVPPLRTRSENEKPELAVEVEQREKQ